MSDQAILFHCSPTLAGIKTASLFMCSYESKNTLLAQIRTFNRALRHKGIVMLPTRMKADRALIYVYRPTRLRHDLQQPLAAQLLREYGYPSTQLEECLPHLVQRLCAYEEFPHEIGLFLGYPPEDVQGFIRHKGCDCKCVGCWKVYGDETAARKCFEQYKKCTRVYCEQHARGISLERLTVAV